MWGRISSAWKLERKHSSYFKNKFWGMIVKGGLIQENMRCGNLYPASSGWSEPTRESEAMVERVLNARWSGRPLSSSFIPVHPLKIRRGKWMKTWKVKKQPGIFKAQLSAGAIAACICCCSCGGSGSRSVGRLIHWRFHWLSMSSFRCLLCDVSINFILLFVFGLSRMWLLFIKKTISV